jgi:hypothetical protein
MTSNETIKQAVVANMGLAFVSLHTVALEYMVNVQRKPLAPAAEAFR